MNNTTNSWEERFAKMFKGEFPYGVPNDIKDFIRAEIKKERANTIADCIGIVEKAPFQYGESDAEWKNVKKYKEYLLTALSQMDLTFKEK